MSAASPDARKQLQSVLRFLEQLPETPQTLYYIRRTRAVLRAADARDRAEMWSVGDMARELQVSPYSARGWTRRSDFPAPVYAGSIWIWLAEDVRAWRRAYVRAKRRRRAF